jgi:hypothetical protein
MSAITVQLSDDLAERLRNQTDRLPEILELGLRELNADMEHGFAGAAEVLEFLAGLPSPQEILDLQPSAPLQSRVRELPDKSRDGLLSPQEEQEWQRYEFLEHLVRMAKAKASVRLGIAPGSHA